MSEKKAVIDTKVNKQFVASCKIIFKDHTYNIGEPIREKDLTFCKAHNLIKKIDKKEGGK